MNYELQITDLRKKAGDFFIGTLTDSVNPRDYWFKMKIRVKSEDGLELSTICRQLKMKVANWKKYFKN
ncbi:MAG TPA: hypothetical protein PLM75_11705 [bacterium]|nr:hypothetical protein [bacterium]